MQESYAEWIWESSRTLAQAVLETETDLMETARGADGLVHRPVREMSRLATEMILNELSRRLTEGGRKEGLRVHRRKRVRFFGLYGPMEVDSPYLYDGATRRSARPVKDQLQITDQGRSRAVERALTDFGAEESFGQAATRFEEHYGWSVNRTTLMRVVEQEAVEAERFVQARLEAAGAAFEERLTSRPVASEVLVELDGCEIRTGELQPSQEPGETAVRRLSRRQRKQQWREVRIGLARQLEEVEPTYVGRMDTYPKVVSQLFSAGVSHGLSPDSETIGVADGGNGLMEELEAQFPNLTFVLDRPHVMKHLHETAEEMGLEKEAREHWVARQIGRIDAGHVRPVIEELRQHQGEGEHRTRQLSGYLHRFRHCVHYDAYKARGLPIGSGQVESAHRWIPQKRLKLPGACWKPETINPMLALRILRANGWWQDYWKSRNAA